ncbi:MAG: 50S ribosomal protein L24 [bacterium]
MSNKIKHIRSGDQVVVLTGKDRGKTGEVIETLPGQEKVLVEGVNVVTRHQRQTSQQQPGGIIEREAPIHISNVQLIDPHSNEPTRVGREYDTNRGRWVRVAKKSGKQID